MLATPAFLSGCQALITAGGFAAQRRSQCWSVTNTGNPQPLPIFRSEAEETDSRIWLHCLKSAGSRKLLYSPDTDIYHIGLPIVQEKLPHSEIYVQLKGRKKDSHRYLCVNSLLEALHNDPDFAQVPQKKRAQVLQSVYACDYVSYLKNIGNISACSLHH